MIVKNGVIVLVEVVVGNDGEDEDGGGTTGGVGDSGDVAASFQDPSKSLAQAIAIFYASDPLIPISLFIDCAVLRVPILYGQIETVEESAVTVLYNTLMNREKTDLVDDCCTRCPTHVDDIAVVCRQMCERWKTDPQKLNGVFHWCGSEFMTKYTMITTLANAFNLPHDHLKPNPIQPTGGTLRPKDCSMDRSKLEALGIGQTTPFKEGIHKVMEPFVTSQ
nr:methionine adenosyltransferase 2 subunit beta-like [Lytechinus pictus]